jgi:hypothetical protein
MYETEPAQVVSIRLHKSTLAKLDDLVQRQKPLWGAAQHGRGSVLRRLIAKEWQATTPPQTSAKPKKAQRPTPTRPKASGAKSRRRKG